MDKNELHPVYIEDMRFERLQTYLSSTEFDHVFILVDENTKRYCLPVIYPYFNFSQLSVIEIKSGETNKTLKTCEKIWDQLTSLNASRHSLLINLGGGVIGDMGGFAASTYKRGIKFINIPTTVLASVDASVGGKTGVDFNGLKNHIGLFSNPEAVFINPVFFDTLDEYQINSAYAEIIKHALIQDSDYWQTILQNKAVDIEDWGSIIQKSIEIKSDIVKKDPTEKGFRKLLNFGHTIGHAIETYSHENGNDPLFHGEAVAIGMIAEAYISRSVCGLSDRDFDIITMFINQNFPKYNIYEGTEKAIEDMLALMQQDKKNKGDQINFTLLSKIGTGVFDQSCSIDLIKESIQYYFNLDF